MTRALPCLAAFALIAAASVSASAQQPAYVGTWASKPTQCKIGQDRQEAPMIMTAKGYDQHEAHCTFSNIQQKGTSWTLRATCSVEGDKQSMTLSLSVAKDRLTMRDEHGARVLQRCP